MLSRRLIPVVSAVAALALPVQASAIVNGQAAAAGEFPAQVFVGANTDGVGGIDRYCSGTLVGSRQVLTAARCATYGLDHSQKLPLSGFDVRVGNVDLSQARHVDVAGNDVNDGYDGATGADDVAILTLAQPIDVELTRVLDDDEDALWAPGTAALVLGWGENQGGFLSSVLRKGDVTTFADADCSAASFDAQVMLCAAGASQNPCAGDSGSPLLVPDGGSFALAGVFSGASCSTRDAPGVYARVGDDPLNAWVHERTPEADFGFEGVGQPRADVPFALVSTSRHPPPEGDAYFTRFRWDLDDDGAFDDATGRRIVMTVHSAGEAVVGIEASRPGGDKASAYFAFDVGPDPNAPEPAPAGTGTGATPAVAPATGPLATILVSGRPKVKHRRLRLRVRFARAAPRGIAVVEIYRGRTRIGVGRVRVKPGATRRVTVRLTPQGRRILRRAASGRLTIRARVRVGRQVLRTRTLTIRR